MQLSKLLKRKGIWYKYHGMIHKKDGDGTIWSIIPNSFDFPNNCFDSIPDGELPGQTEQDIKNRYTNMFKNARFEMLDFGLMQDTRKDTNKKQLDPSKPAIIHYKGQNHMVKIDGNVYRVYNYVNQTLEEIVCKVGEEESIRGCSGFDF